MAAKESVLRGPKAVRSKTRLLTRSMTTGTAVMTLPKGSRPLYAVLSGVASDAGTTATANIGTTSTATELISGHDVKTAASGRQAFMVTGAATAMGTVLTVDTPIFFKYAETGTASTVGAWKITVFYSDGNSINDDTI